MRKKTFSLTTILKLFTDQSEFNELPTGGWAERNKVRTI